MIAETLAELTVPIESLRAYGRNPRRGDVAAIKRSLEVNGQYRPLVVNRRTGEVLAGNHTLAAALELAWAEIAVTFVDVDEEQAARIVLVDNRTNDLAGYDQGELAQLLESLEELDGSGYEQGDLEALLAVFGEEQATTETPALAPPENPETKRGDLYRLGDHRLLCGDCREAADLDRVLDGRAIALAFTSPPYAEQRAYDKASDFRPVPPAEYVDWFRPVAANIAERLAPDGSWFVNLKPSADGLDTELYVFDLVLAHVREWGWHFATEYCWERYGVPKSVTRRFKNQFEPVYQFTRGDWKMHPEAVRHPSDFVPVPGGPGIGNTNWADAQGGNGPVFGAQKRRINLLVGALGEGQQGTGATSDVFVGNGLAYPGNRLPSFASSHEATGHTAAFPVGLPEFFVKAYTDAGDLVLDPFMGSGSTLLAGENQGRPVCGIEISPGYCDVIVERWERHSGGKAERL